MRALLDGMEDLSLNDVERPPDDFRHDFMQRFSDNMDWSNGRPIKLEDMNAEGHSDSEEEEEGEVGMEDGLDVGERHGVHIV